VPRDPLITAYEGHAHDAVLRAIRASRYRRAVVVFVNSPRGEYGRLDRGGRTRHERAFTRAAYRLVFDGPAAAGEPSQWSLKLTWRDQLSPGRPGWLARAVAVRIFPRQEARVPAGQSWVRDEGGFGRSAPDRRIDG
jgi:hypothetical protein